VIVKKGILLAVIALLAAPASSQGQGRSRDEQRQRNEIRLMEGVLIQAVRIGAEEVGREMEKFEPAGVTVLTGTPRARGFILDAYGVFFDVEIPALNQSVVWSLMTVQRDRLLDRELEQLRTALGAMPAGPTRDQAQQALTQVSKTVGPTTPRSGVSGGSLGVQAVPDPSQPRPGQVSAAAATAPPDPDSLYTEAVKAKLIDGMLNHSLQINLGQEEWLTVAARASEGPLAPSGLSDSITIILRVKGSDLAVYHADPTKRDEIREKVKADAKVF
jgi:hypothetical protein